MLKLSIVYLIKGFSDFIFLEILPFILIVEDCVMTESGALAPVLISVPGKNFGVLFCILYVTLTGNAIPRFCGKNFPNSI